MTKDQHFLASAESLGVSPLQAQRLLAMGKGVFQKTIASGEGVARGRVSASLRAAYVILGVDNAPQAIRVVCQHITPPARRTYEPPSVAPESKDWSGPFLQAARTLGATERQADYLLQSANGEGTKNIADDEGLCHASISTQLSRAYVAMGAQHRGHAIAIVMRYMLDAETTLHRRLTQSQPL